MWPKDGGLANTGMTWSDALQAAISLNSGSGLCGYKDWHLPNEKELHSLVGGYADPTYALPKGHPFVNVTPDYYYWTSTTSTYNASNARGVFMGLGSVSNLDKTYNYIYFWPVRTLPPGSDLWISKRASSTGLRASMAVRRPGDHLPDWASTSAG